MTEEWMWKAMLDYFVVFVLFLHYLPCSKKEEKSVYKETEKPRDPVESGRDGDSELP